MSEDTDATLDEAIKGIAIPSGAQERFEYSRKDFLNLLEQKEREFKSLGMSSEGIRQWKLEEIGKWTSSLPGWFKRLDEEKREPDVIRRGISPAQPKSHLVRNVVVIVLVFVLVLGGLVVFLALAGQGAGTHPTVHVSGVWPGGGGEYFGASGYVTNTLTGLTFTSQGQRFAVSLVQGAYSVDLPSNYNYTITGTILVGYEHYIPCQYALGTYGCTDHTYSKLCGTLDLSSNQTSIERDISC